ncbi:MAG TPA: DUF2238 domain-containing protein [Verrucomicrobiae bacterium]|nr:DUF2238 domain-containing protein [Verrucomicrobiae bacterium]
MIITESTSVRYVHVVLLFSLVAVFIWSAIKPYQLGTWFLEVTPLVVGVALTIFGYRRFRLTTLAYIFVWLGSVVVLIGGHYTYGRVPLFELLKSIVGSNRNYYDRFGHFIFGMVVALIVREFLLRKSPLRPGKLLIILNLGLSLSLSALYELSEWAVGLFMGSAAEAFLGLQGDIWDTHWDMFLALLGAISFLLIFSKIHNRYLTKEIGFYPLI